MFDWSSRQGCGCPGGSVIIVRGSDDSSGKEQYNSQMKYLTLITGDIVSKAMVPFPFDHTNCVFLLFESGRC